MHTLFMPFLTGYWHRLWHVLRGHHLANLWDVGRWAEVECSCGQLWLESWAL